MTASININPGCRIVGDFVDKNEIDEASKGASIGVSQPTRLIATYVDSLPKDTNIRQFTVLLRDNRVATVRGHGLRYLPNPSNPADLGTYAILARTCDEEVLVALFPASEVTGVFTGGLEAARTSA